MNEYTGLWIGKYYNEQTPEIEICYPSQNENFVGTSEYVVFDNNLQDQTSDCSVVLYFTAQQRFLSINKDVARKNIVSANKRKQEILKNHYKDFNLIRSIALNYGHSIFEADKILEKLRSKSDIFQDESLDYIKGFSDDDFDNLYKEDHIRNNIDHELQREILEEYFDYADSIQRSDDEGWFYENTDDGWENNLIDTDE